MPKPKAEKPGFLSEEFINESDESDGEKANGATLTANENPEDSESNGSDDDHLEAANKSKEARSRSATSVDSDASSVQGSESGTEQSSKSSDSEPDDEDDRSRKDGDSQTNSDSEDSNTSKDSRKRGHDDAMKGRSEQAKRQKTNISKQPASSQNLDSMASNITRGNADNDGPTKITGKEFSPPQGFNPLTLGASDFASDNAEIFSNLDRKQIWHISAPSSLNIESIKNIDLEAASKGEAILTNGGISYTMQESSAQYETLMLVDGTSARYKPSRAKLAKSFKLGVKSNNENESSSQAGDHQSPKKGASRFVAQSPGEKKAARTQPQQLHMRYQPFGSETVKQRAAVKVSSAAASNSRALLDTSSPKKSAHQSQVIADPLLDARASSNAFPTYPPKPVMFSIPALNNQDVEMKNAPSPSKTVDGSKTASDSKISQKSKINGTVPQSSGQAKAKKKKSKLVDQGSL